MREPLTLDSRLSAIERMIPPCRSVADIGADHGMLGAHLLLTGRCQRVQLLDVSEASLRKAGRLIRRLGLWDRASFGVGDGAQALVETPDCAVIAGMGGLTIAGIVERGREALGECLRVMQPNVAIAALRLKLSQMGYCLVDEDIVRAGGRWYVVMAAGRGEARYNDMELLAGPVLLRKGHPNLAGYARFRARVAREALEGARQGGGAAAYELMKQVACWEEILRGCDGE